MESEYMQNTEIRELQKIEEEPHLRRIKTKMRVENDFLDALTNFEIKDKLSITNECSNIICALNSEDRELAKEHLSGKGPIKHKDCNIYFTLFDEVKQGSFWLMNDNVSQGVQIVNV